MLNKHSKNKSWTPIHYAHEFRQQRHTICVCVCVCFEGQRLCVSACVFVCVYAFAIFTKIQFMENTTVILLSFSRKL